MSVKPCSVVRSTPRTCTSHMQASVTRSESCPVLVMGSASILFGRCGVRCAHACQGGTSHPGTSSACTVDSNCGTVCLASDAMADMRQGLSAWPHAVPCCCRLQHLTTELHALTRRSMKLPGCTPLRRSAADPGVAVMLVTLPGDALPAGSDCSVPPA